MKERNRRRKSYPVPKRIGTVRVIPSGEPLLVRGEKWITMVPEDYEENDRLWEFSTTTGRIIQTR
jgi:hypothetical protein